MGWLRQASWLQILTFNFLGFGFLMSWLTPKTPSISPQELQTPPTTKQGTPIRIAFGPQHQENSNLVDYGNVRSYPIKAKGGKK